MFSIGSAVRTYSGELGTVLSGPWTDWENGEQLVTVQVGNRRFPHGVAELETVSSLIVVMEDEPIHTDEHPFCSDPDCACHSPVYNAETYDKEVGRPLVDGLLTGQEAYRILWDRQV